MEHLEKLEDFLKKRKKKMTQLSQSKLQKSGLKKRKFDKRTQKIVTISTDNIHEEKEKVEVDDLSEAEISVN